MGSYDKTCHNLGIQLLHIYWDTMKERLHYILCGIWHTYTHLWDLILRHATYHMHDIIYDCCKALFILTTINCRRGQNGNAIAYDDLLFVTTSLYWHIHRVCHGCGTSMRLCNYDIQLDVYHTIRRSYIAPIANIRVSYTHVFFFCVAYFS